jgi:MFS family permease
LFGLATLIALEWAGFAVILLVAFLYGVIDAYYWPSRDAILIDILPAADLPRANSIMLTTAQIGWIAGPALGGFLVGIFSLSAVLFALALILLAMAMLFVHLLRRYADTPARASSVGGRSHCEKAALFIQDLKLGLSYVWHHPQFSVLMLLFAVANILFMGPMQQSVPLIAKELSGSAGAFGTMWASWGAGMATGGVAMSILAPQHGRFLIVVGMVLIESVLLAALAFLHSLLVVYVVMFAIGVCIACNNIPTMTMLQVYSDKDKVGRVMGLNDTISLGLTPLSYVAVSALLLAGVGHRAILTVAGVAMFFFGIFMLARYPVIRRTD